MAGSGFHSNINERKDTENRFSPDRSGVSPIVAVLVLIVVAIFGAAMISIILGSITTDVSRRGTDIDIGEGINTQILIAGSPVMQPINEMLSKQYESMHPGVQFFSDGPGSAEGVVAAGMGIADIGAPSRLPTMDELSRYPRLKPELLGGRAVVIIAHDSLNTLLTTGVSCQDMQSIYNQSKQPLSPILSGVQVVARNTDKSGSDEIFSQWLTNGQSATLDGYNATPDGVSMFDADGNANVFSAVSSTPGAIGYIDWLYVANNNPLVSHVIVIPIVNNANGQVQVPGDDRILAEIKYINDNSYDSGLVNQLYYVTNGEPGPIVSDYLKFAMSPGAVPLYHQAYAYSVYDLE